MAKMKWIGTNNWCNFPDINHNDMKNFRPYTWLLITIIFASACDRITPPYESLTDSREGASIFVAKANGGIQNLAIFPYEPERTFRFNAGFGAVGLPANPIEVTFSEDTHAFDSLNAIRIANNQQPYLRFPDDAYRIDQLKLVIPKGGLSSDFATLTYFPENFDAENDHLLALTITNASGYPITSLAKTLLVVAPKLEPKPLATRGWVATASSQQDNGWEDTGLASAVLDGNLSTIWHAQYDPVSTTFPHWLSFDMVSEHFVTKIAMAPRQNNPRGFTKFRLEGSLDGSNWFSLGEDLRFDPANLAYQEYPIEPQQLKHIRLTMLEGLQDLSFLAEFVVYAY